MDLNQIENIKFYLDYDTFNINEKKEFLYSNITIISQKNNNFNFFSSKEKDDILLQVRSIINDKDISYFLICTKNFEDIDLINVLIKIFKFRLLKFQNIGYFWYGIIVNSINKSILEEKLLTEGEYQLQKYEIQNNSYYLEQKEELDLLMKKLIDECKEMTISKMYNYMNIINSNVEQLNKKIQNTHNTYDLINYSCKNMNKDNSIDSTNTNLDNEKQEIVLNENEKVENIKNELQKFINKKTKRFLCVMVHLFKIDIWEDILQYLERLNKFGIKFDLYVNISVNDNFDIGKKEYKELLEHLDDIDIYENYYLTISDNRGMDLGGFFVSYKKMLDLNLQYEYFIKIHSKTNFNWRFCMLYSLLGSDKIIKNNLDLLKDKNIGMIGNNKMSINKLYVNGNKVIKYIDHYYKYFDIDKDIKGEFIPGTIFWIKGDILEKHFDIEKLEKLYEEMPKDYCGSKTNNKEGLPHGFERFFGVLVKSSGYETYSYDDIL